VIQPTQISGQREICFSRWCFAVHGAKVDVAIRVGDVQERVVPPVGVREDVADLPSLLLRLGQMTP
jgi:hypothetical protein